MKTNRLYNVKNDKGKLVKASRLCLVFDEKTNCYKDDKVNVTMSKQAAVKLADEVEQIYHKTKLGMPVLRFFCETYPNPFRIML